MEFYEGRLIETSYGVYDGEDAIKLIRRAGLEIEDDADYAEIFSSLEAILQKLNVSNPEKLEEIRKKIAISYDIPNDSKVETGGG